MRKQKLLHRSSLDAAQTCSSDEPYNYFIAADQYSRAKHNLCDSVKSLWLACAQLQTFFFFFLSNLV